MRKRPLRPNLALAAVGFTVLFGVLLACVRTVQKPEAEGWVVPEGQGVAQVGSGGSSMQKSLLPTPRPPGAPVLTPTPDPPHNLPAMRIEPEEYVIQAGDALGKIAQQYGISLAELVQANEIINPDFVQPGQTLVIPVATPENPGPAFKLIPDSELVYGPALAGFDLAAFIQGQGGYLAQYSELVGEKTLTGAEIVQKVSQNYSVNPRLLLAVLQYQSHWLTEANPGEGTLEDPIGIGTSPRKGLYSQLVWVADTLNHGYYVWRVNGVATWLLADGTVVPIAPTINAGTAAVQYLFASLYNLQDWNQVVSENGFINTYTALFGYPFDLAVEPLLPPNLEQPALQLPFESGKQWRFTGGPHGGWDNGSAWAALDFAPPSEALGCVKSDEWVVASADGQILRTGEGAVIQDLDGDGFEGTGWVIFYMHIERRERVEPGTTIKTGDRIGHPSCEGGVSDGTHVHLARKYNGEWIPADQDVPFVLDGWISRGQGNYYDGVLERNGQIIEAWADRDHENIIQR
jgi:murein DD-endopeptidase MepM/ murein hydrolase activator NlpD